MVEMSTRRAVLLFNRFNPVISLLNPTSTVTMPMTNTKTNANTNTKQDTDKEKDKVVNDGRDVNELASTSIQPIQPSHLFIELHLNRRARLFCDIHYTQY